MKNKRTTVFILLLLVGFTSTVQGQVFPGRSLPIDGGLTMGIIAAVVFGVYKIRNIKK